MHAGRHSFPGIGSCVMIEAMARERTKVAVVGGGLAGLACARALTSRGIDTHVYEASGRVGGRVRTDEVDGFLIDRGFQVLLSAYPEIDEHLDRHELDLRRFEPGALVRRNGGFQLVADPLRRPLAAPGMLAGGLVKPRDARAVLRLVREAGKPGAHAAASAPETTTIEALRRAGVSGSMLEGFWRPFLGGIMLERDLTTTSRFLYFVLSMFSGGPAGVPAGGMGRIPEMLAAQLPLGTVRLNSKVKSIEKGRLRLAGGDKVDADFVVIATDGAQAAKLSDEVRAPRMRSVGQIAFDSGVNPPEHGPILVLDGERSGPVNNLQVMSDVAPRYAPNGHSLITCSILEPDLDPDDERLEAAVRAQLSGWYGSLADGWKMLRIDRVESALPAQPVGSLDPPERPLRLRSWLWTAGDHRATASIEGALSSGRHAGEQVAAAVTEPR